MAGEFLMPPGFESDPKVRLGVGKAALVAELSSDYPNPGRVSALRAYVDRYGAQTLQEEARHRQAVIESQYPEIDQ